MDEVCIILDKHRPCNDLAKYKLLQKRLLPFVHFEKQFALSTGNPFQNILFLPHFHYF